MLTHDHNHVRMHKNLKKYKLKQAYSDSSPCNLQLVKEQINEALSNFYNTVDKSYLQIGVKNPVFRDAKHNYCQFYCKLLYENLLQETDSGVAFWC